MDDATPLPEDRERLLRAVFAESKTEYMTLTDLARWFGVGRNKMRTVLRHMPDVERCGSLYRIPAHQMPPAYWASRICTDLHDPGSAGDDS